MTEYSEAVPETIGNVRGELQAIEETLRLLVASAPDTSEMSPENATRARNAVTALKTAREFAERSHVALGMALHALGLNPNGSG